MLKEWKWTMRAESWRKSFEFECNSNEFECNSDEIGRENLYLFWWSCLMISSVYQWNVHVNKPFHSTCCVSSLSVGYSLKWSIFFNGQYFLIIIYLFTAQVIRVMLTKLPKLVTSNLILYRWIRKGLRSDWYTACLRMSCTIEFST